MAILINQEPYKVVTLLSDRDYPYQIIEAIWINETVEEAISVDDVNDVKNPNVNFHPRHICDVLGENRHLYDPRIVEGALKLLTLGKVVLPNVNE